MEECKAVKTPIDVRSHLTLPSQEEIEEAADLPYQALIGAMMYLAVCCRPDIAHSVSVLSQFNSRFGQQHWQAGKRVLRYLQGNEGMCLKFQRDNPGLTGYSDAEWAADQDNRRSHTGYTYILAGGCMSWESCKQREHFCRLERNTWLSARRAEKQFTSQDY
ncbi:hypothetical protein JTB14_021268 [Gonioctena quinquepunctata]|nr:hypothetical protein JTB14_021268 [Gonioctena quinquepunctata]